jgi:uncharacterized protein YndB with AHSA1/START domain
MTDNGTLIENGGVATLEFTRRLQASPERVWQALTEPGDLTSWLAEGSSFDGGLGGEVSLDFGEGGIITGEVMTWDPPRLLSYSWVFPDGAESLVTFEVTADGDGTLLSLTHERVPTQTARGYTPGWHAFLDRFDAFVTGASVPTWDERFEVVAARYEG